jgi:hypothetical protein
VITSCFLRVGFKFFVQSKFGFDPGHNVLPKSVLLYYFAVVSFFLSVVRTDSTYDSSLDQN